MRDIAIVCLENIDHGHPTKEGCWLWKRKAHKNGYGQIHINGKQYSSHVLAHEVFKGNVPQGLQVLHTCDVKLCCNPEHLYSGTHQQNMDDREARGRTAYGNRNGSIKHPDRLPRGSKHANARLDEKAVQKIKIDYKGGMTQVALAKIFGVSQSTISWITKGGGWAHVSA